MLQKHDRPDDRMEAMLRLWGAEQAAQRQDLPPTPPVLKPVRLDLRYALLCAGCVAAGAIVAIGAMLLARHNGKASLSDSRPTMLAHEESPGVSKSDNVPRVTAAVERTTPDSPLQTLEKKLTDVQSQRDDALVLAAKADARRKQLAEEKVDLQKQLHQANRVKEAVAQLDRRIEALRREQDAALAMANRLRKKLAARREQHHAKYQRMLEVHVTALAPNRQGLDAIQTAVRTSNLLQRCAALRTKEDGAEMQNMLDRIEAVLIRMDFLDTNDVTSIIRFEHQLRRGDLLSNITASLPRTSQNRNLQIFLAEVDLILSGVQRVG